MKRTANVACNGSVNKREDKIKAQNQGSSLKMTLHRGTSINPIIRKKQNYEHYKRTS